MNQPQKERVLPEQIPAHLARAEGMRQKGMPDEALREVNAYLNDHFDSVPSLVLGANILLDAERVGMAHALLKRVVQLEPTNRYVWNNLGMCCSVAANYEEAEVMFFRGLKLNPQDPLAHMNLAQVYNNTNQPILALKHANLAIEIDSSLATAFYNRALADIALGNFERGWADYDSCLGVPKIRKERIYGMIPRWNGTEGKSIIAYGEQGLGDEIAFASCIPELAKKNAVTIECNPGLWGLFKRSFGLETHGTRFSEKVNWLVDRNTGQMRKFDGAVAFGSLPQYYRNDVSHISGAPYLIADQERRLQWRALLGSLGPKMKVGITWTGGVKSTGKARRSVDLDDLLPILRQDATFVSLQYMDAPEILAMERDHGIKVHHWRHATQTPDYDDTAALVAELDLVISVTTAVIHLSGALGQKCWVMAPKCPRWFYGITGESLPWYSSVKLYRQKGAWVEVIAKIATDLRSLISPPIKVIS